MELIDRQPEERTEERTETHACDLISRQAAIDAIADYLRRVCLAFSDYMTDDESKECATCILQLVPSAQPERERGEWYKPKEYPRDSYRYICSNCQDVAYYVTGNNGKKQKEDKPKCGYRYCPNCGADMRGEQDG